MLLRGRSTTSSASRREDVALLHSRCGVYTKADVAAHILDSVGWKADSNLSHQRLLEPAAGNGVFVVEAAKRLVQSCRDFGITPSTSNLEDRLVAFELHRPEAIKARRILATALRSMKLPERTCKALAKKWIVAGDFLISEDLAHGFTHVVGNPPYIRWSKIPPLLKGVYEAQLSRQMIGGDLFVPFLDLSLERLVVGGRFGFLCSDRWQYMAFAADFRRKWLPQLDIVSNSQLAADDAFVERVDTYPTVLIGRKRSALSTAVAVGRTVSRTTLKDAGYTVRVGPALGHTPAYVLAPEDDSVESELLHPWLDGSEILDGRIAYRGRRVVSMCRSDGSLVDLRLFPRLRTRLKSYEDNLRDRAIVRNGASWYRPIDRVCAAEWKRPKLLVPELAKVPRVALDTSGAIPSHGVYAIFAPNDDLTELVALFENGGLGRALKGIAPKVKGGYMRCYKRFLEQIVLKRSRT